MPQPTDTPVVGVDLRPLPVAALSVYVHIPFCSSRCNYCDFYFETTRSPRVIAATLERILEEAAYFMDATGHPRIASLYFGGGTPSVVPPALLDPFLERLGSILGIAGPAASGGAEARGRGIETTFEANPESVSGELLEVLLGRGVNRVSLGVQSFHDASLHALTRRADRASILAALELLRGASTGVGRLRLNVDLITGIPGQSREMARADVDTALAFDVDHFSVYSLTVEEHTPLRQALEGGVRTMPRRERQDELWLAARSAIVEQGFEWYEISNFARPGSRSEHNLRYWRMEPYLGLGPGGVSTIPMAHDRSDAASASSVRLTNPNLFVYGSRLERGWHHAVEVLEPRSLLYEHLITGLRTDEGVSLPRLERLFGLDLARRWRFELGRWRREGIADGAALEGGRFVLSPEGRLALDRRLLEIGEWIDGIGELSTASWPDEERQES